MSGLLQYWSERQSLETVRHTTDYTIFTSDYTIFTSDYTTLYIVTNCRLPVGGLKALKLLESVLYY